jgi:Zn ribbon nucleic-acid-binding protein
MATNPKVKPCPDCKTDQWISVYTYDSGGRCVECDKCWYRGPIEGSIRQAIKSHNEAVGGKNG